MSTQYKATCKCGATVDVPYSDNFKDWLKVHNECLKHPSKREWVGLTDEEFREIYNHSDFEVDHGWEYERAIEAKLKEKNT